MDFYFHLLGSTGKDNIDGSLCMEDLEWKHDSQHHTALEWVDGLFYAGAGFRIYRVLSGQLRWTV